MKNIFSFVKADFDLFIDSKGYEAESFLEHLQADLDNDPASALYFTDGESDSFTDDQKCEILRVAEAFNIPTNRQELAEWAGRVFDDGCGVWVVVNGGGPSLVEFAPDFFDDLATDENYNDAVEVLTPGNEYDDFAAVMDAAEYSASRLFLKVSHKTGYNQENMDIQVQWWPL